MMYYVDSPQATQTSNATPNTANDCFFITPGSLRMVWLKSLKCSGKAAALTAITGIIIRIVKWTTTASSGGTALTPSPTDDGYQAAKHSAGYSATTVTSGTGGPTALGSVGFSASGPGNWINPSTAFEESPSIQAGATKSIDLENISGTASMNFELDVGTTE